jgi:carbamoyl-phosphate synthase large subunit
MYRCLTKSSYNLEDYAIMPIRREDIYLIKQWRNEQMDILRQNKILSDEEQDRYFNEIIYPSFNMEQPNQILFSFLKKGKLIGYGGIVHISWVDKRGELSFLLETNRNEDKFLYRRELNYFFKLLCKPFFDELQFNKITTEAYNLRPYLIEELEHMGFRHEGTLKGQSLINGLFVDSILHAFFKNTYDKKDAGANVLITSISRKVPLLQAVKEAIVKSGKSILLYGGDIDNQAIGKYFVDVFWEMPLLKDLSIESLIGYCKDHNISVIIPSRDGELAYFATYRLKLFEQGIQVMISPPETIQFCLDKMLFYEECLKHEISVIPTSLHLESIHSTSGYVVKERYGAGAKSIGLKLNKEEAIKHSRSLKSPLFQPYVKGDEYSIDIYITADNTMKGMVIRKRILVLNGESQITSNVEHEGISKLVSRFVLAFKFTGHIILQAIVDKNENIYLIECNPRFGGASSFSVSCGLDTFYWFLKESEGCDISAIPFTYNSKDRYKQIRYPKDIIFMADGISI